MNCKNVNTDKLTQSTGESKAPSRSIFQNEKTAFRRSSIIEKAITRGKKLWNIDKFMLWIRNQETCKKGTTNAVRKYVHKNTRAVRAKLPVHIRSKQELTPLEGPFMKIENTNHNFKPCYKVFTHEPSICIRKLYTRSPFDDDKIQLNFIKRLKYSENQKSACIANHPLPVKCRPVVKISRPQRQYCECCNIYFQNLDQHLQGPKHRQFVENASNFDCITTLLEELKQSFVCDIPNFSGNSATPLSFMMVDQTSLDNTDEVSACNKLATSPLQKETDVSDYPLTRVPPLCNRMEYALSSEACTNGHYVQDSRSVSNVAPETCCTPDYYNLSDHVRKANGASANLLGEDPFLSSYEVPSGINKTIKGNSTIEMNLNIAGLHIELESPEVFGAADPMFSDKTSEDSHGFDMQCFLNNIMKDNWMSDALPPFTQAMETTIHTIQPAIIDNSLVSTNGNTDEFWPDELLSMPVQRSERPTPAALFPYENAHLKYNWTVKYRSDTKIVILRTQKTISVR